MGVMEWLGIREDASSSVPQLRSEVTAAREQVAMLQESMADLELAMEDVGWDRLNAASTQEFSRSGLERSATLCRIMAVKHPLIKRGLAIRTSYVHGQGVEISARSAGDDGEQDVNAVIQRFLDDRSNRAALTGQQATEELERALGTDGNVFLACFTSPLTGRVQVRSISFSDIQDIVTNPDDRDEPWYYRREWVERTWTSAGTFVDQQRQAYYPDINYFPASRPQSIGGVPVRWDAPILHISVNRLDGWQFGIGDVYAALDWARMQRDFLVDWATLVKALSQFAFRASTRGSKSQRLREKLARIPHGNPALGNENAVGATFVGDENTTLEAIPKTGATIDSESGKPLATMIAAALGVPVTMLLSDPGQTGARAVAETLDKPTRLEMENRRGIWSEAYRTLLEYVVREAVRAPQGPLQGTLRRDPYSGQLDYELSGNNTSLTLDIEWPTLEDTPLDVVVDAIVAADSTGRFPPEQTLRLLLIALGVKDVDEVMAGMLDDDGRFIPPLVSAGQAAADAFRRGDDPAGVI